MKAAWSMILVLLLTSFACAKATTPTISPQDRTRAIAAYHALPATALRAKKIEKLPAGIAVTRIDVSSHIRSASFGHTTTLLVAEGGTLFYVENGRSTNRPSELFGPFPIAK